ncbi:MAG: hypothetical protein ACRC37_06290 [Lentisphaeria bacterium]
MLARNESTSMKVVGDVEAIRQEVAKIIKESGWYMYQDLPSKDCFIVMNVPGAIDTTDVGVFITSQSEKEVLVQVASLNRSAQAIVAEKIFSNL